MGRSSKFKGKCVILDRKNSKPPKWAKIFCKIMLPPEVRAGGLQDFEQTFKRISDEKGRFAASSWYWTQIFQMLPSFIINIIVWNVIMFKNYLKIALRNISKQKGFSFLNISGLAVGMACCILMLLWVKDELSYDSFNENSENIYRIVRHVQAKNMTNKYGIMPNPLGPAIKENFPEVDKFSRYSIVTWPVTAGDKPFSDITMCLADTSFFDMFTFPAVVGDVKAAMRDPLSVIITKNMALKCFGEEEAIGKMIKTRWAQYNVAAVIENIPRNSHMQFECVMPINYNRADYLGNWQYAWQYATYIQFHKNSFNIDFTKKIENLIMQNEPSGSTLNVKIVLQPLKDVHLRSEFAEEKENVGKGNILYVYLFSLTAFCILIIACVNFMSLSTARSGKRQKEIAMRKVVGARRKDIIRQFFGESIILSFFALVLAVFLILLVLPAFNEFTGKFIQFKILCNLDSIIALAGVTFFTGLVAGSYPAFFLSSFKPLKMLAGLGASNTRKSNSFRSVLVVGQFAFTSILITASLVIFSQLEYIKNKDLGYNKDHIISFHSSSVRHSYKPFKNELLRNPNVLNVSKSVSPNRIGNAYGETDNFDWPGRNPDDGITIFHCVIDYDYLSTFGMSLEEGRFFRKEFLADSNNFVLNETAVKVMGLESPIGKRFKFEDREGIIIGIIKDFHITSLHSEIKPVVFIPTGGWNIHIKFSSVDTKKTLDDINGIWEKHRMDGVYDFGYEFLDETIDNLYSSEYNISKVFRLFTFLAVFISCLGLLGLASFMAEQRKKEIGIRKTLGATLSYIVLLLSKEFVKWVFLANLIAIPAAYFSMNKWLNNFVYHTDINPMILILTGFLVLAIVLFSAGYQTLKAALANPVDSLRNE